MNDNNLHSDFEEGWKPVRIKGELFWLFGISFGMAGLMIFGAVQAVRWAISLFQ